MKQRLFLISSAADLYFFDIPFKEVLIGMIILIGAYWTIFISCIEKDPKRIIDGLKGISFLSDIICFLATTYVVMFSISSVALLPILAVALALLAFLFKKKQSLLKKIKEFISPKDKTEIPPDPYLENKDE